MWLLLVSTGLRREEVLAPTRDGVDFERKQMRVRRNVQRIRRELIFGTPKTKRSLRTVSRPQQCPKALLERKEARRKERSDAALKRAPLPHHPTGLAFPTVTGRVTDPRSLNRMLTVLRRDAKVPRVRVHDLRHTCASLLLAQGADARTITETLGHGTITMTLDTYAHVMDTTLKAAVARMNHALGLDEDETARVGQWPPHEVR
ncbi:site-specific integrase [Streptomyces sp. TRM70308]|uniref:site-specific integrase n=1 Tax=Streptomyces sp. TRM70308 TaxID=3131932 RepID=UPI003D067F2F